MIETIKATAKHIMRIENVSIATAKRRVKMIREAVKKRCLKLSDLKEWYELDDLQINSLI